MTRPKIVIVGAGFGGLDAAQRFASKAVDVLVIDRHNFHTFTPLLYQVATCGLDPSEIAYPLRGIFYDQGNLRFMLGEVVGINTAGQSLDVRTNGQVQSVAYDYLILAAGSVTNTFGNASIAEHGFSLKDLDDAVILRNHILKLFEKAAWHEDAEKREALTTLVVVGGGPTGLETAGALHELYNKVLRKEFPEMHNLQARVILVEATDALLRPFPESLRLSALAQLESLGVEVLLNSPVAEVGEGFIKLQDGQLIPTYTLVWSAGVKASPLAELLGVELKAGARVPVQPNLEAVGLPNVYVIGDMAYLEDENGTPYPMLIQPAKQQGKHAAQNILRRLGGEAEMPFEYRDLGIMATIGRRRAVAWIFNQVMLSGFIAWIAWLFLHLIWLIGFRNRINVLVNWVWNYLTYDRSVRLILEPDHHARQKPTPNPDESP